MATYHKQMFSKNIFLLKLAGMWSFYNENQKTKFQHFAITIFYLITCQTYRTFINFYDTRRVYNDLNDLINHLGMVLSHFLGDMKVLIMFLHRKRILKVLKSLENEGFEYGEVEEFSPYEIAMEQKKLTERAVLIFFPLVTSVPLTGAIPSIITLFSNSNVNITCMEILPYPISVPFVINSSLACFMAILTQALPVLLFGWQIAAVDVLYVSTLVGLQSHIRIINGAFKTIRKRALKKLDWDLDHDILLETNCKDLINLMDNDIRRLTIHLQRVIGLFKEIEYSFNKIVLLQVLVMIFLGVCSLYMMSTLDVTSGAFVQQFFYFVAISTQVTLYCWFGNQITLAGLSVPSAIYSSEWFSASRYFKQAMMLNMMRMNHSLYVTIGKFSPLTISTLVAIFRGSYSYFAVLHNNKN